MLGQGGSRKAIGDSVSLLPSLSNDNANRAVAESLTPSEETPAARRNSLRRYGRFDAKGSHCHARRRLDKAAAGTAGVADQQGARRSGEGAIPALAIFRTRPARHLFGIAFFPWPPSPFPWPPSPFESSALPLQCLRLFLCGRTRLSFVHLKPKLLFRPSSHSRRRSSSGSTRRGGRT